MDYEQRAKMGGPIKNIHIVRAIERVPASFRIIPFSISTRVLLAHLIRCKKTHIYVRINNTGKFARAEIKPYRAIGLASKMAWQVQRNGTAKIQQNGPAKYSKIARQI